MVHWQNRPDEESGVSNYQIVRTPQGKEVQAIVLSEQLVGTKLHYWRGRSVPCSGPDCEACKGGNVARWKGYVLITNRACSQVYIFEFTQRAFDAFDRFFTEKGTLRGAIMTAKRLGKRPNSPLSITFEAGRHDEDLLPPEEDIAQMLSRMWETRKLHESATRTSQHDETLTRGDQR